MKTPPFSAGVPYFSSVDVDDEITMKEYLVEKELYIHFASIVFSQNMHSARVWKYEDELTFSENAYIKTQKISEAVECRYKDFKLMKSKGVSEK